MAEIGTNQSQDALVDPPAPIGKAGKSARSKARRTGQVIERGENKWLIRVFLGRDEMTGKRNYSFQENDLREDLT